jgi:hypothetical protein
VAEPSLLPSPSPSPIHPPSSSENWAHNHQQKKTRRGILLFIPGGIAEKRVDSGNMAARFLFVERCHVLSSRDHQCAFPPERDLRLVLVFSVLCCHSFLRWLDWTSTILMLQCACRNRAQADKNFLDWLKNKMNVLCLADVRLEGMMLPSINRWIELAIKRSVEPTAGSR